MKPSLGSCSDKFRIEPFETEKELNDFVYTNESSNAIFIAAVFTQSWNDSSEFKIVSGRKWFFVHFGQLSKFSQAEVTFLKQQNLSQAEVTFLKQ